MSLTLPSRLRSYPAKRPLRAGATWLSPLVLGVAAALIGTCAWASGTSAVGVTVATAVAVVMALAGIAFAVVRGARSRPTDRAAIRHLVASADADHQATLSATESVADIRDGDGARASDDHVYSPAAVDPSESLTVSDSEDPVDSVESGSAPDPEPASQQALRARVHLLEATLEEQSASLARLQAQIDTNDRREGGLERVEVILKALRERASGSPESQSMVGRVEAAVSRLCPSPGVRRVTLPTPVAGVRAAHAPQPLLAALDTAATAPPVAPLPERTSAPPVVGRIPEPATAPPPAGLIPVLATAPAPIGLIPERATAPPPLGLVPEPASVPPLVGQVAEAATLPPATVEATPAPEPRPDPSEAVEPAVAPVPDARVLPVPAPPSPPAPRAGRWRRRGTA